METPSAPAAPDPVATANAQAAANTKTAITQSELNQTNQVTPQGTLNYSQSGTNADGTPQFTATQTYSPGEQGIYNTGVQTRQNVANIGASQSAKIGTLLDTPFSVDSATSDKIQGLQNEFLDPQWQRQQDALQTQLINKGVRPGSQQYTTAMSDFSNQRQKAYDQSYLDSYNTGQQAALTQRNQPINEISALLSNSQVSQPNYTNTPQTGVAPTDVIGAEQQALNQQNVGFQANVANQQALTSGLFGLGKTALGGWMASDINVKENIDVVGERPDGLHVIDYDYTPETGIDGRYRGLIAQEVKDVYPDAAARSKAGTLTVNYDRVPGGGLFALGAS